MTDGNRVLRKYTDDHGRFEFPGIYPRTWILKVVGSSLPAHHFLETEEMQLDLGPGRTEKVALRVLPRLRSIQILEQKDLTVSRAE